MAPCRRGADLRQGSLFKRRLDHHFAVEAAEDIGL
jgi:hypothetical protein